MVINHLINGMILLVLSIESWLFSKWTSDSSYIFIGFIVAKFQGFPCSGGSNPGVELEPETTCIGAY